MNLQDNHDDKRGSSRLNDLGYLEMLLHPLGKYKGDVYKITYQIGLVT